MKVSLGTVQFGLDYGVSNLTGKVPAQTAADILELAQKAGVDTLDTAIGYGDAEATLGKVANGDWRIVTKLPGLPDGVTNAAPWVDDQIAASLRRLHRHRVDAVLLHQPKDLSGPAGRQLWHALQTLKEAGLCDRIGVSIYDPDDLVALPSGCWPDLVQAPYNPFDRRLETSGWADKLVEKGAEIHVRSTFLQGALLMPRAARNAKFPLHIKAFDAWENFLNESGQGGLGAALGLSISRTWIERVVVGVVSTHQLISILEAYDSSFQIPPLSLAMPDQSLIDPRFWGKK